MNHKIEGTRGWDSIALEAAFKLWMQAMGTTGSFPMRMAANLIRAQTNGRDGRVTAPIARAKRMTPSPGGQGRDRFEFHALIDAKDEVRAEHTGMTGRTNWGNVAGGKRQRP